MRAVATLLAAATLAAACSSNAEDRSSPADLEPTVRTYIEVFLAGDADRAWTMNTQRCRDEVPRPVFDVSVEMIAERYADARVRSYEQEIDGDAATVTYRFDAPAIDQLNERWVVEGDAWRHDDC